MPLEFTEYALPRASDGKLAQMPPGGENTTQTVAIGAGTTQSAAFGNNTRMIEISKVDADCRIAIGLNPVAITTGVGQTRFLRAASEYAFQVQPGDKLAVIAA